MDLVRTLERKTFTSDGTNGSVCREISISAGLICRVLGNAGLTSVYITPLDEDYQNLWTAMPKEKVESVTEMEVIALAATGKLSPMDLRETE